MTSPRQVLPDTVYLVTRRCLERRFFLKPIAEVTQAFGYLLAITARRYGVLVHAACVLSNHYHLVVTDTRATLPDFLKDLNGILARFLNALHGRKETVFPAGSYSAVELADEGAVLEACAYALANPAAAGLLPRARSWPGLWSAPEHVGGDGTEFARPAVFFDPAGSLPARARLWFTVPRGFEPGPFRSSLAARLGALEGEAAAAMKAKRRPFLGLRAILAQRVNDRATGEEKPRGSKNRVAAVDIWVWVFATARRWWFRCAYEGALQTFRSGLRTVEFPAGTFHMRHRLGACAATG